MKGKINDKDILFGFAIGYLIFINSKFVFGTYSQIFTTNSIMVVLLLYFYERFKNNKNKK